MDVDERPEAEATKVTEQEYAFAKYNVKPQLPKRYTDEQYNRHLKSDDWTREETDYLMDLVEEYDLRWVVIADRYDYQPRPSESSEADSTALVPAKRYRTMEQIKARYYMVAANMLALEHPPSEMSEAEFELHEKMMKFDPDREKARKELAALQLNRTADEVREEGILLEELKRIVANEQNFIAERKELYARLEVPISVGNTTMYQSSQGLSQLLQTLLQADKSKKRRSILGAENAAASPVGQTPTQGTSSSARDSRAETPSGPAASATNKKAAAAAAAAASSAAQPTVKTLTPAEEAKYGVQHHERLTPGVQFRNDRAQKLTQAKSNVQTQKLAAALTELEVPPRLVMPTDRVCKEFERLIHSVNLLLDARKVAEKVESEIKVLEAAREERQRKEREAGQGKEKAIKAEPEDQQPSTSADGDLSKSAENAATSKSLSDDKKPDAVAGDSAEDAPAEEDDAEVADGAAEAAAPEDKDKDVSSSSSHKRSASVLSAVSDKSTKRLRK
jgi:DNA methyltransferase 1-associated protein 1